MKKLFFILFLFSGVTAFGQRYLENATRWNFTNNVKFSKPFTLSRDTTAAGDTGVLAYIDGSAWLKDESGFYVKIAKLSDLAGGSTNSNIGSAYRLVLPGTNDVKTLSPKYGILLDSATTGEIGIKVDSATLFPALRATVSAGDATGKQSIIPNAKSFITDSIHAIGDSYTYGLGLASQDSVYLNRYAALHGLHITNSGQSGAGFYRISYQMFLNEKPLNRTKPTFVLLGLNDIRYGGTDIRTLNKIENGVRTAIFNQFIKEADGANFTGSVTKTGTWTDSSTWAPYYGKSLFLNGGKGIQSSSAGATASWTFNNTNVGVGFIGMPSTAGKFWIYIDNVLTDSVDVNLQNDGNDLVAGAIPGTACVKVISGLSSGSHTVKVEVKSGSVIIDYFGTMNAPQNCYPISFSSIAKMTPAAWASGSATAGSNEAVDQANLVVRRVIKEFKRVDNTYPVYWFDLTKYIDYATDFQGDLVHPTEAGQRKYLRSLEEFVNNAGIGPDGFEEQPTFSADHFGDGAGSVQNQTGSIQTGAFRISGISQMERGFYSGIGAASMTFRSDWSNKNFSFVNDSTTTAGANNFRMGPNAGTSLNSSSANDLLLGFGAGQNATSATNIVALGVNALNACTTCTDGVAIAPFAAAGLGSATDFVAIGKNAMSGATGSDGSYSIAIGSHALQAGGGTMNAVYGPYSFYQATSSASYNVGLGGFTGTTTTSGSWQINIGPYAQSSSASASGEINIGGAIHAVAANQSNSTYTVVDAARVGIGTNAPDVSAKLEVKATDKGFRITPMTTAQRDAMPSLSNGLQIYCSDCTATDGSTGVNQTYNGTTWKNWW